MEFYEEKRPWGSFKEFIKNQEATVKIITVHPNEQLSLQYHLHRKEFWKVLSGNPQVQIDDPASGRAGKKVEAKVGDEFIIPEKAKHRLTSGNEKTEVLEISFGKFDENDIVRLEDKYGRPTNQ